LDYLFVIPYQECIPRMNSIFIILKMVNYILEIYFEFKNFSKYDDYDDTEPGHIVKELNLTAVDGKPSSFDYIMLNETSLRICLLLRIDCEMHTYF
jgi:hypothetical protein